MTESGNSTFMQNCETRMQDPSKNTLCIGNLTVLGTNRDLIGNNLHYFVEKLKTLQSIVQYHLMYIIEIMLEALANETGKLIYNCKKLCSFCTLLV